MTDNPLIDRAAAELAAREQREPVPDSVLPTVMRGVWADLRRSRLVPLPDVSGPAFVAQHVVTAVLRSALEPVPALRLRSGGLELDEPGAVAVSVAIAVRFGTDLAELTGRARELARAAVGEQFGWDVHRVDVAVVDVFTGIDEPENDRD